MMIKDYLDSYISNFGTDYPQSSDAFYAFCEVMCKSNDCTIAGDITVYAEKDTGNVVSQSMAYKDGEFDEDNYLIRTTYDSRPIFKLVNYIKGRGTNSSIDFDEISNSNCKQLILLVNYIKNKGLPRDYSFLCDICTMYQTHNNMTKSELEVIDLVSKLFDYDDSNIDDRWKGFKISNKRGMDALARL